MDVFLDVIEATAKERGISLSELSRQATGNSSAFKNMREAERTRTRRSAIENLQRFADVLGLEFYLGPPRRNPSSHEYAHALREMASEFRTDVRISPLDASVGEPPLRRIAMPSEWFERHGIEPDNAALVGMLDDAMTPAIPEGATAVIDRSLTDVGAGQGKVYAIRLGSETLLRRCDLTAYELVVRADNPAYMIDTRKRRHLPLNPILGQVRAVISSMD